MMTSQNKRRASTVLIAVGAAIALQYVGGAPALGATDDAPPASLTFEPRAVAIEYGSAWGFEMLAKNSGCSTRDCDDALTLTIRPANGSSTTVSETVVPISPQEAAYLNAYSTPELMALPVGDYEISGAISAADGTSLPMRSRNEPASLRITPATVGIELRVASDENQPSGAIVSAQLTGEFANALADCFGSDLCHAKFPAGTWTLSIVDASGDLIISREFEKPQGASQFASFYWHDVPADSDFTASATFTPQANDAGNFSITSAFGVPFSSPKSDPVEIDEIPRSSIETEQVENESTIPLWAAVAGAIAILVLGTSTAVIGLRAQRRADAATSAEFAEDDSLPHDIELES